MKVVSLCTRFGNFLLMPLSYRRREERAVDRSPLIKIRCCFNFGHCLEAIAIAKCLGLFLLHLIKTREVRLSLVLHHHPKRCSEGLEIWLGFLGCPGILIPSGSLARERICNLDPDTLFLVFHFSKVDFQWE